MTVGVATAFAALAQAATINTLVSFNNSNGANPYASLLADASGNLYGTAGSGGANTYGTVFKLDASNGYALTTLVSFSKNANGYNPRAALIADGAGNLYGTAYYGGVGGAGTVFKLDASSNYSITTLASFSGSNGLFPNGPIADGAGNLYGMTYQGGAGAGAGYGTVFKLDASNNYALATLASLSNTTGYYPLGGVTADAAGNLYGTTFFGGAGNYGTVFKLDASNNYAFSTLVEFNSTNGSRPEGNLLVDAAGNLYGTTSKGGPSNQGTVFKLNASNNYALTTLASFTNSTGGVPYAGVIADAAGNLYGTTVTGGGANIKGTVFKLSASNNYALSTLVSFNGANGTNPFGDLIADAHGNLYGTTNLGGANNLGTVFQLTNTGFAVPEPAGLSIAPVVLLLAGRRRGRCSS